MFLILLTLILHLVPVLWKLQYNVLIFHRLQLLLQREPLFQAGRQQLEDRQVGGDHKGLARLLSADDTFGEYFLKWQLASWGQCFSITHYLWSPQCCVNSFIPATLHISVEDRCLPACITSLQLYWKATQDHMHRLNTGNWMFVMYESFVTLMQIYYNMYSLFHCLRDFVPLFLIQTSGMSTLHWTQCCIVLWDVAILCKFSERAVVEHMKNSSLLRITSLSNVLRAVL